MNREHTRYFSKINERRHALLTIQFSGGKRTDAQEAELASILAQMDVLEAAEAMVRGQFDWQHEQIKGMADVAGKMYEALRAHEKATTGNVFDELEVRNQRDRALALLRDPRVGTSCGYPDEPMAKCSGDWGEGADVKISDTCWWHSCRALQDDVDRAP